MSDCTFCGQSAGLFKSQHEACKDRHEYAPGEIRDLAARAAMNAGELDTFRARVDEIARGGFLNDGEVATAISEGFTRAVNRRWKTACSRRRKTTRSANSWSIAG
jgi:hypothetical protein